MVAARQRILRIPRLAIEDVRQGYLTHGLLPAGVVHNGVLREDGGAVCTAVFLPVGRRPINVSSSTVLL